MENNTIFLVISFIISFIVSFIIFKKMDKSNNKLIIPTLENYENLSFIDENKVCYKYSKIKVECDS